MPAFHLLSLQAWSCRNRNQIKQVWEPSYRQMLGVVALKPSKAPDTWWVHPLVTWPLWHSHIIATAVQIQFNVQTYVQPVIFHKQPWPQFPKLSFRQCFCKVFSSFWTSSVCSCRRLMEYCPVLPLKSSRPTRNKLSLKQDWLHSSLMTFWRCQDWVTCHTSIPGSDWIESHIQK